MQKSLKEEIKHLERLIGNNQDSIVFARLADAYMQSGRLDEAIDICERGVRIHPFYVTGHFILGKCYMEKKLFDQAEKELKRTIALDPKYIAAHKEYADLMAQIGWSTTSEMTCDEILRIDPLNEKARQKLEEIKAQASHISPKMDDGSLEPEIPKEKPEDIQPKIEPVESDDSDFLSEKSEPSLAPNNDFSFPAESPSSNDSENFIENDEAILADIFNDNNLSDIQPETSDSSTIEYEEDKETGFTPSETPPAPEQGGFPLDPMDDHSEEFDYQSHESTLEFEKESDPFYEMNKQKEEDKTLEPEKEAPTDTPEIAPVEVPEAPPAEVPDDSPFDIPVEQAKEHPDADPFPIAEPAFTKTDKKPTTPAEPIRADDEKVKPAAEPKRPLTKQSKEKIVTPTLGEIYAAQHQFSKAIGVYELLLRKDQDNALYKQKIDMLRKKLEEEADA